MNTKCKYMTNWDATRAFAKAGGWTMLARAMNYQRWDKCKVAYSKNNDPYKKSHLNLTTP